MKKNRNLPENKKPFFGKEMVVVNVGIKPFYEDLKKLNIKVAHVDWEPPAGGDEEVTALLDKIL
jgi:FdrA protein